MSILGYSLKSCLEASLVSHNSMMANASIHNISALISWSGLYFRLFPATINKCNALTLNFLYETTPRWLQPAHWTSGGGSNPEHDFYRSRHSRSQCGFTCDEKTKAKHNKNNCTTERQQNPFPTCECRNKACLRPVFLHQCSVFTEFTFLNDYNIWLLLSQSHPRMSPIFSHLTAFISYRISTVSGYIIFIFNSISIIPRDVPH